MISVLECSSQILSVVHPSTWTNTRDYSAQRGYLLSGAVEWRRTQKHATSSYCGVGNSVRTQLHQLYLVFVHADGGYPDWFDVLDQENRPVLTEREILRNLQAIVADADQLPVHDVRLMQTICGLSCVLILVI